jgi:hypothetical protein
MRITHHNNNINRNEIQVILWLYMTKIGCSNVCGGLSGIRRNELEKLSWNNRGCNGELQHYSGIL